MEKYEIYRVNMDYVQDKFMNNVRTKNRPGLITKIYDNRIVLVAMVTTKNHPNQYEIRDWKEAGLDRKSYVNFGVVQDFDSGEIGEYVGKLSDFDIQRIKSQRWDESLMKNINQNNNKESEIKESMAEKSKKEYLEEYLGVDVTESGYDDNVFETDDGEEYLVVDEDERDDYTKNDIMAFIDDVGVEGFTENFQEWIYDNAVDEDFLDSILEEEMDYFSDEGDEDNAKYIANIVENGSASEKAEYFIDNYGKEEFAEMMKNNDGYDYQAIIEECIEWDGYPHFLARYDGEEIELADDRGYIQFYAYRQN